MDYLFVGYFSHPDDESEIIKSSKKSAQFAANKFQINLISGLFSNLSQNSKLSAFSMLPVGSYPFNNHKLVFKKNSKKINDIKVIIPGFINLPIVKKIIRKYYLKKHIKEFLHSSRTKKCIISYSINNETLKIIYKFKKTKNLTLHIIVPDLPSPYGISRYKLNFFSNFLGLKKIRKLKNFDSFTLLSYKMAKVIQTDNKPYCIIEGLLDSNNLNKQKKIAYKNKSKSILYTGTIEKEFGIENLIIEFMKNPQLELELWICGGGSYKDVLKHKIKSDIRIKYYGQVSNEDAMKMQRDAYILINPRANDKFTEYSFPSKILEYLQSGTIVLSQKLEGIPNEYYSHLVTYDESKENDLIKKIETILAYSHTYLDDFVFKSNVWVNQFKNNISQTKKILKTISEFERNV